MPTKNVDIVETDKGVKLSVKVLPGARNNGVRGVINGRLKIGITVVAERGKANAALVKWLSKSFDVPKNRILIVAGSTSPQKTIELIGVNAIEIQARIARMVADPSSDPS